jgi:hypothetical protein
MHTCFWLWILIVIYAWMQGRLISHMLLRTATMEHRNRRGERFDPQTMTLLSTLLPRIAIPRSLFIIPGLTLTCSHQQDGCTNGKIHIFTICYFSNGRRQQRGQVNLGKTTRLSCLECKVWMSCPPLSTRWRPKWTSSHFYSIDLLLLWLWYCMHDYHYHYGIGCTIIIMTLFVCKTMILFFWWGFVRSFTLIYA